MNSKTYWEKREAEALKIYIKDEAEYSKELDRIYADMLDGIQKEIDGFYQKYASAEGITLAEAKKRVSKLDIEKYERKAAKYVKDASLDRKANGGKTNFKGYYFSDEANAEMRLYNATMKINRLEMLKANIGLETIKGHAELESFMEGILRGRTVEELERQAGILGKTVQNNAKMANAIVNGSFKVDKVGERTTFSDRIWQYHDEMKNELSHLLSTGLIQGKNSRAIMKDLKKYWYGKDPKTNGGARYCMERLMRTELARVQTEAQKQSFVRNGFDMYTFHANRSCCPICSGLDGKHFKVKDMMPGDNAPPVHPHCRCSTSAYEDSEEYEAWLDFLAGGGTTEEWNVKTGKAVAKPKATKPKFTPAKTIAEAKAFAESKGVKYVEYGKLPIETINILNEALLTLPKSIRPRFIGDSKNYEKAFYGTQYKLPRKHSSFYGVSQDSSAYGMYIKGNDGIYRLNLDEGGQMVGISSVNNTVKKISASKATAQEKYRARHGNDWFFNETGETTAAHEMGHVYANVRGLPKGFEYAAKAWAERSKCDMLKEPSEAWAEAWASYHTGINKDKVPEDVLEFIRKASDEDEN